MRRIRSRLDKILGLDGESGRLGWTKEKEVAHGIDGENKEIKRQNSETKRPLVELNQVGEPDQGAVRGQAALAVTGQVDKGQPTSMGKTKDRDRTDLVPVEARPVRRGLEAVLEAARGRMDRGRTDQGQMGLGRMDHGRMDPRGKEALLRVTFRRASGSCSSV